MSGPTDPLKALTIAARAALTDPEAHRKPAPAHFGDHYDHALALIEFGPAVRELIHHRRARDRALAAGRFVVAQKHGRRIAECENVINGLLDLLTQDPCPPAPIRANSRAEIRARCAERQARVAELLAQGVSQTQIAKQIGCHFSTVSGDVAKLRNAQTRPPVRTRTRPAHASAPA